MLESRPSPSRGKRFAYLLIAGIILSDVGLLLLLTSQPITFLSFMWGTLLLASLPAVVFIAFWASSLTAARYQVEGDALVIDWGRMRNVVPLSGIRELILGEHGPELKQFRGISWPGCYVGQGLVKDVQHGITDLKTVFCATGPLRQQLLVLTDTVAYGVSPLDLRNFADCLAALRPGEGSDEALPPPASSSFLHWRFWRDRQAQQLLAIAILLNGALFAFLCLIFNTLPALVPLHFDGSGIVDHLASPSTLFLLPLLGLFAWSLNWVVGWFFYREETERPLAKLLWTASVVVQLTTWAALVGLLK